MSLYESISEAITEAMKSRDEVRLRTIRSIRAEILKKEKEGKGKPNDDQVVELIKRLVNQRKESIEIFSKNGRQELADAEAAELAILQEFLPESLDQDAIAAIVQAVVEETGASSPRDMGKVMGLAMQRLKATGKLFDGGLVNQLVKSHLGGS